VLSNSQRINLIIHDHPPITVDSVEPLQLTQRPSQQRACDSFKDYQFSVVVFCLYVLSLFAQVPKPVYLFIYLWWCIHFLNTP